MKANKVISLDVDLLEQLKREPNASGLINDLVREHFQFKDIKKMSLEEKKELLVKVKRKEDLERQIKELGL